MRRRSSQQILLAAVLLLVVAFILGRPNAEGPPLDPESVGELGTLGLIEFLEASGASVQRGVPAIGDNVGTALLLVDRLDGAEREDLLDWIQAGGDAVIADTTSPLLATGLVGTAAGEDLQRGECEIGGLEGVNQLSATSLALLDPVPGSSTCFGDANGAYLIRFPDGDGTVTGLGGAVPFVNRQLDEADNAVLAGRLLLDDPNPTVAVIYTSNLDAGGQRSPLELIGSNVRWFGWQLVMVTFIGLLWAIRRFGKLVDEPAVVELPGSLSVRATAELHRRSSTPERSLATIQRALFSRVRSEYRLPPEVDGALAAGIVADHTGLPDGDVALLTGAAASTHVEPMEQAIELDRVGRSVLGDPAAPDAALPATSPPEEPVTHQEATNV